MRADLGDLIRVTDLNIFQKSHTPFRECVTDLYFSNESYVFSRVRAADAALLLKFKLSPRKTSDPALGNASEMFATGGADPPAKCLKLSR